MTHVFRWEVPVDDEPHAVTMPPGPLLHVDCRHPDRLDLWAEHPDGGPVAARTFLVVGTGSPYPGPEWHAVATALTPALSESFAGLGHAAVPRGALVWHLLERA